VQVLVANGPGTVTLSLPQSIATTSPVQFGTLSTIGQCVGPLSYSVGTASQAGTAVIGTGTTWNATYVPGVICWPGPICSVVTGFVNATQLTSINSQTVTNAAYSLCYGDIEMAQGTLLVAGSIYTSLAAQRVTKTDANGVLTTTAAMTNGQLIIGSTGADVVTSTITPGASNSLTVVDGPGSITIDTAQPLTSTSAPTFSSLTLAGLSPNMALITGPSSGLITGLALTNGQFVIGATSGAPAAATLTGTANQVIVTNAANSVTLSLPQSIAPSSGVTFASLTDTGLTQHRMVIVGASGLLATPSALTNGQLYIGSTGADPVAATLTTFATNSIVYSVGAGSLAIDTVQGITTTSPVQFFSVTDTGQCVGSTVYNTGTASQTTTTVTGSGFTSSMAPGIICWPGVTTCSFITAFVSATTLTTSNSASVSAAAFTLCYAGVESAQGSLAVAGAIYSSLAASRMVITGANGVLSAGAALTNGQFFIGSTGVAPVAGTISPGATGSITVAAGAGTVTVDTVQSIATTASPAFVSTVLSGVTAKSLVYSSSSNVLTGLTLTSGQIAIGSTGNIPVAASPTSPLGTIGITPGSGSLAFDVAPHAIISSGAFTPTCAFASGQTTYSTGTTRQDSAIITAVGGGASFPAGITTGAVIYWDTNQCAYIIGRISPTQLIAYPPQTVSAITYRIWYNGNQAAEGSQSVAGLLQNLGAAMIGGGFSFYQTGNASQTGFAITGVGTTFLPAMAGGLLICPTGSTVTVSFIANYLTSTALTSAESQTIPVTPCVIAYGGHQVRPPFGASRASPISR